MALPVYDTGLVLAVQHIKHDNLAREAMVTYALFDATVGFTAQQWADHLQNVFQANLKAKFDTEIVLSKTTTLKGNGSAVYTTGESTAAGTRGTNAVSSVTANTAVLVKKNTGFGGRTARGRMYFPWFISEGGVDEIGNIAGADVTAIQTVCDAWLAVVNGTPAAASMVIANRTYDRPWDQAGRQLVSVDVGPAVTSLTVETIAATQRRRMPRV